jgi:hypothetical protein
MGFVIYLAGGFALFMATQAAGTFDVKVIPQAQDESTPALGRLLLDKQFHGDLEAVSKGQMLSTGTTVSDSAGYVAIEHVTGTLNGKRGSFALQHNGIMTRGVGTLTISVVPDSGTDELVGLTGKMTINIDDGDHSYVFEYSLA